MSKSIKLKNNTYIDTQGIAFDKHILQDIILEQPKCHTVYNIGGANQYLVIDLGSANLFEMIHLKIIGNGYAEKPIDSVIQGYHYTPAGSFLNYKIHNNSLVLNAWFILDTTIKIVIQIPNVYMSFSVMLWTPIHKLVAHRSTISGSASFPNYTSRVQCVGV